MADRFLEGRVAVVTGTGRGIGRAIALALGGAGAQLALVDRTATDTAETARLVRDAGAPVQPGRSWPWITAGVIPGE